MDPETIYRTIEALRKIRKFVSHNPRLRQDSIAVREFMRESAQLMEQLHAVAPLLDSVDTSPNHKKDQ